MEVMNECPLDPGGYFIVRGTEKVILIQEQLSKNRVIIEADERTISSRIRHQSTHERKSKTHVTLKKERINLQHNVLAEPIPIVIILKALGGLTDFEIMQLVTGSDARYQDDFEINFSEAVVAEVFTEQQALEYIGARVKMGMKGRPPRGGPPQPRRSVIEEGLDALANIVIAHIPVEGLEFYPKAVYVAMMTRRVLMARHNPKLVDDRDFVGNKRFELAGQLLSLLFEDLFKNFLSSLKFNIENTLKKQHRAIPADPLLQIGAQGKHITEGLNRAIQTGNWTVQRFRMNRAGVTHVLSRLSYIAALGMMTRISSQFERPAKLAALVLFSRRNGVCSVHLIPPKARLAASSRTWR